jgi:exosortase/archaeosortase family protein
VTAGALPRPGPAGHRAGHRGAGRRGTRRTPPAVTVSTLAGPLLASALCCALAITAVRENLLLRGFEARLASHVIAVVTGQPAGSIPQTPTFWFTLTPHQEMGLQITQECTVVLMTTPFLVATAFLVWRRSSTVRPVVACVVSACMLLVVNQLRILTIIMFVLHMGYGGGFYWGHTLIGSLITIAGGSLTLVVYGLIAIRRGTPRRSRLSAG